MKHETLQHNKKRNAALQNNCNIMKKESQHNMGIATT